MQIIIDRNDLICRIWRPGLLTITEGCVRDPNFFWHIMRHNSVIKRDLRHFGIRKHIAKYIGFLYIVQYVHMLFDLQQIVAFIHGDRPICKHVSAIMVCHFTMSRLSYIAHLYYCIQYCDYMSTIIFHKKHQLI